MSKSVGFIGCGSMAECIMAGALKSGALKADTTYVSNRTESTVERLKKAYGVRNGTPCEVTRACDIIILGVKPYGIADMCQTIKNEVTQEKVIISIAAAISIETIEKNLPASSKVIRVMPNVPALVGYAMTSLSPNASTTKEDVDLVYSLFEAVGKVEVVPESSIHAVIGCSGSSVAYAFLFLEALTDAAVHGGLTRVQAQNMAAQAVVGAAKMMQETGKSPAQLKDMVCSPGGTTIEAVRYLEKGGMRSAVIEAAIECMEKSKKLEKQYN
ncbi:pyrroline-5-carboxylate reductase [Strigomonas culicis]|uniref:Pyrroline-5-carboxylate reductase n=1 Tax=Strigomonas culicis TaxID=28005 RepID=S9V9J4_9TRYP|nr:pyrroline-5-carboxylate reductase [Strigomonas culicis]|eukprot:EPY23646.1 pyrroline-5-carboxylate reductase [Strigomonas culicis]